jgi:hypothetical protein
MSILFSNKGKIPELIVGRGPGSFAPNTVELRYF